MNERRVKNMQHAILKCVNIKWSGSSGIKAEMIKSTGDCRMKIFWKYVIKYRQPLHDCQTKQNQYTSFHVIKTIMLRQQNNLFLKP